MKNQLFLAVLAFVAVVTLWSISIDGQKVLNLKCKDRPVQQNFDIKRYMGKWFLLYRYYTLFQRGCECDYVNYTLNADGSFTNSICCLLISAGFCSDQKTGFTNPNQNPLEGKFNVSSAKTSNYLVLATDYDNYAILYSCVPTLNSLPIEGLWVHSRTHQLNPKISETVYKLLETYSFNKSLFVVTDHDPKRCGNIEYINYANLPTY